jgi:ribosomal protein L34
MVLQPYGETVLLLELQLARKRWQEFQPTCSRHKLAHGFVMRGRIPPRNATVTGRTFVGADRSPTDRYPDADSPQFAVPA